MVEHYPSEPKSGVSLLVQQLWQTALMMRMVADGMQTSLQHGLLTHLKMVGGCSGARSSDGCGARCFYLL